MLKAFVQADNSRKETIDNYNADIEKAIAEYKKGEVMSHEGCTQNGKKMVMAKRKITWTKSAIIQLNHSVVRNSFQPFLNA